MEKSISISPFVFTEAFNTSLNGAWLNLLRFNESDPGDWPQQIL